ncbi:ankyrin repeat domain-containing protein [Wolbachia endosymbiont (group A) of Aleiodes leptofemur]|uniref:ankyrin repeat domain-containing protein n=1 Tax=Wolbachia endosymbiont (group A) of Aleiodes leptofemur TaxID=3077919 RepID=UPI003341ED77
MSEVLSFISGAGVGVGVASCAFGLGASASVMGAVPSSASIARYISSLVASFICDDKLKNIKFVNLVDKVNNDVLEDLVIRCGIELFQAFQFQILQFTGNEINESVLGKLSCAGAWRAKEYLIRTGPSELSCDEMIKAVLLGKLNDMRYSHSLAFTHSSQTICANQVYEKTAVLVSSSLVFSYSQSCIPEYGLRSPLVFEKDAFEGFPQGVSYYVKKIDIFPSQSLHPCASQQIDFEREVELIKESISGMKLATKYDTNEIKVLFTELLAEFKQRRGIGQSQGPDDGRGGSGGHGGGSGGYGGGSGGYGGGSGGYGGGSGGYGGGSGGYGGGSGGYGGGSGGYGGGSGGYGGGSGGYGDVVVDISEDMDISLSSSDNKVSRHSLSRKRRSDLPTEANKKKRCIEGEEKKSQHFVDDGKLDKVKSSVKVVHRLSSTNTQRVYGKNLDLIYVNSYLGQTFVHEAVCNFSYLKVSSLHIRDNTMINLADRDGTTPFHYACTVGNLQMVELLHKCQANPNLTDNLGNDALCYSAFNGRLEIVKFLFAQGYGFNLGYKVPPLHLAALGGQVKTLEFLFEKFSRCMKETSHDNNLIHFAIASGKREVVDFLIKKDRSLLDKKDDTCVSPTIFAVLHGQLEVLKFLIKEGADISANDSGGANVLHHAVLSGKSDIVSFLAENYPELIDVTDRYGISPFGYSMLMDMQSIGEFLFKQLVHSSRDGLLSINTLGVIVQHGHFALAEILLKSSLQHMKRVNKDGVTFLIMAILSSGELKLIEFLVKQDTNLISMPGSEGVTPIYYAILLGRLELVKFLARQDPHLATSPDRDGIFPIDFAAFLNKTRIVAFLSTLHSGYECLEFLAQHYPHLPTLCCEQGRTFLDLVGVCSELNLIKLLLKKRPDLLRAHDMYGMALIHYSISFSRLEVVEFLLNIQPGLIRFPNKLGLIPIKFAIFNNDLKMVSFLSRKDPTLIIDSHQNRDLFSWAIMLCRLESLESIFRIHHNVDKELLAFLLSFAYENNRFEIAKFLTTSFPFLESRYFVSSIEIQDKALQRILQNINNILGYGNQIRDVDDLLTLEFATLNECYDYCLQYRDILLAAKQYGLHNCSNQSFAVTSMEVIHEGDRTGYKCVNNVLTEFKQNVTSDTSRQVTLIVNLGNNHWVTLVIIYRSENYFAYYADCYNMGVEAGVSRSVEDVLGENVRIEDVSTVQEGDYYDSAIWALENAQAINTALLENRNVNGCLRSHMDKKIKRESISLELERENNSVYLPIQIEIPDQSREQIYNLLIKSLKHKSARRAELSTCMVECFRVCDPELFGEEGEEVTISRVERIPASGQEAPILLNVSGSSNFGNPRSALEVPEASSVFNHNRSGATNSRR